MSDQLVPLFVYILSQSQAFFFILSHTLKTIEVLFFVRKMDGISRTRWNQMTEEEQQAYIQSRVCDTDSEDSNSGDFSDGSDDEWEPTANDQHNADYSDAEDGRTIEWEEEVNSDDDLEELLEDSQSTPAEEVARQSPPAEEVTRKVTFFMGRDKKTRWSIVPPLHNGILAHNIFRPKRSQGPHPDTMMLSQIKTFNRILSQEICSIIIRETNRKGLLVVKAHNDKQEASKKVWAPLTYKELETFLGLLIMAGVCHNERVTVHEMWSNKSHPIFLTNKPVGIYLWITFLLHYRLLNY